MSGEARIIVTGTFLWNGDGTSTDPKDIQAYNDAMSELSAYLEDATEWFEDITLVNVEATG